MDQPPKKNNDRLALIKKKKKTVKSSAKNDIGLLENLVTGIVQNIQDKQTAEELLKEQEEIALEEKESALEKLTEETKSKDRGLLDLKALKEFFNRLDYSTFVIVVLTGQIRGKHLFALYHGSKKLKEYCDRGFQPVDKEGKEIGIHQEQYLFFLLLKSMNIRIPVRKSPREVYFERTVGGQVWCFGSNNVGQLGLRGGKDRRTPTLNSDLKDIIQVSSSGDQFLCLDTRGRVWAFGQNLHGQLGLGNNITRRIPRMIPSLVDIIQVHTNHLHSLCLDNQGRVWGFGYNEFGQLGLGDKINRNSPELIPNLTQIVQVSTGRCFSVCLDSDGHIWSFGDNTNGKLGNGQWTETVDATPNLVPDLNGIIQISCGEHHTLCLDSNGYVWGFGVNMSGELGYPTFTPVVSSPVRIFNLPPIIKVCAGYQNSLLITAYQYVWVMGKNDRGQLGLDDDQRRKIEAEEFFTKEAFESVKARHPPNTKFGQVTLPTRIPNLENIMDVSCGKSHSLCLGLNGKVWAFGSNQYGQCGLDNSKRNIPTMIPNLENVVQVNAATLSSICLIRK